jgi:hypothetical protein
MNTMTAAMTSATTALRRVALRLGPVIPMVIPINQVYLPTAILVGTLARPKYRPTDLIGIRI